MDQEATEDSPTAGSSSSIGNGSLSSGVAPGNPKALLSQLLAINPALALAASTNPAIAAMAAAAALNAPSFNTPTLPSQPLSPSVPNPAVAALAAAAALKASSSGIPPPSLPQDISLHTESLSHHAINGVHTQEKNPFLPSGNMPFGKPPPTQLLAEELRVEDQTYELKDGWGKRVTQRTSGSSMGKFDVYLTNPISTKRLRSIPELLKFIKDNPYCPIDPTVVNMDDPAKFPPGKFSKATEKFIKAVIEMKSGQEISEVDQRWRQKLFNEAPEPAKPKTPKTPKEPKTPKTPKPPKVPGSQVERAPKRGPGRPTGYSPINGYVQSPLSRPLNIQPLNNFSSPEKYTAWVPSSNQYVPQGFSELSESFTHNKVLELERHFVENVSMPTVEQLQEWSTQLELNPAEVSHWFRCKWRVKLMAPLLQGNSISPSNNGCEKGSENASYSTIDSGSDGGKCDNEGDEFINIECETIVEEVSQEPPKETSVSS